MGESHSLFRIAIFIGFVLLMGSVLATPWVYVGQPLPPNSAWGQFSSGIQNFPVFNDPFAQHPGASFTMRPMSSPSETGFVSGARPATVTNPGNVTPNCYGSPPVKWHGCLFNGETNLGTGTFLNLTSARSSVVVGMESIPGIAGDLLVGSLILYYTCKYVTTQYKIDFTFYDYTRQQVTTNTIDMPKCGTVFELHTFTINFVGPDYPTATRFNGGFAELHGEIAVPGPVDNINYLAVSVNPPHPTDCATDTICSINQGFQTVLNIGSYIVNAIIFGFQVIAWFVGMIGIFFSSLLSILNIPGAPPLVSGFVGILIIGCLFFVAIVIMGKVRGTGNTG